MKVACLGMGWWSDVLADAIKRSGKLTIAACFSRSEEKRQKFAAKYGLTFPLLADADHYVAEKYGVWQKRSMYGRSYMGIARTTYLIDRTGHVVRRWDKVKVDGHAEDVLEAVQQLE